MKEEDILPSYPLLLEREDRDCVNKFCKMYQLYHSIKEASIFSVEVEDFEEWYVTFSQDNETVCFHWYEFVTLEVPDLINGYITTVLGIYKELIPLGELFVSCDIQDVWGTLTEYIANKEEFTEAGGYIIRLLESPLLTFPENLTELIQELTKEMLPAVSEEEEDQIRFIQANLVGDGIYRSD